MLGKPYFTEQFPQLISTNMEVGGALYYHIDGRVPELHMLYIGLVGLWYPTHTHTHTHTHIYGMHVLVNVRN